MGRGSVVALGLAASAGAFLLAVDALRSGVFVDVGRANVCGTKRTSICFVPERGIVEAGDGRREMRVRRGDGRLEDVVAFDAWEETPPRGTAVVLETWRNGGIYSATKRDGVGYVFVPSTGARYKAQQAPDRAEAVVQALIAAAIGTFILVRLFRGRRPPWRLNEEAPPSLSG